MLDRTPRSIVPLILLLPLAVLGPSGTAAAGGDSRVEAAVAAAREWLSVVDSGSYESSWEQSATLFRTAVTAEQWKSALGATRTPLGPVRSREVQSATYATTLPGAPDGEYVVIQFATSFDNKKTAVETVTPMKDTDGAWRVSGYYIK